MGPVRGPTGNWLRIGNIAPNSPYFSLRPGTDITLNHLKDEHGPTATGSGENFGGLRMDPPTTWGNKMFNWPGAKRTETKRAIETTGAFDGGGHWFQQSEDVHGTGVM